MTKSLPPLRKPSRWARALAACALLAVVACGAARPASAAGDPVHSDGRFYEVVVSGRIESVKKSLISALEGRNYAIINVLNVQQGLKNRGIKAPPIILIEFCNLVDAYRVTRRAEAFETFAPCRLALFEKNGKTTVMTLRPRYMARVLRDKGLDAAGAAALAAFDKDVHDILADIAAGGF